VDTEYQTVAARIYSGSSPDPCHTEFDGVTYEFDQDQDISVACQTVMGGILEAPKPKTSAYTDTTACSYNSSAEKRMTFDAIRAVVNVPFSA